MALSIYKPGQGYWTRTMSVVGFGTLVLAGVGWLWQEFTAWFAGFDQILYLQGGMAVFVIAGFGLLFYKLFGTNQRIVDFCIATETEMKKVNWPSKKAIYGLTLVVIGGTLFIALLLFGIDFGFSLLFQKIGILKLD
ncbi:MAG: preprotein translocase subunit SecE [Planctomycetota bacterium]